MGVVMTRRVWLLDRPTLAYPPDDPRSVRKRARVLASDTVGWPRADGDRWPCHGNGWCDALAIWRTSDGWTTGYYCGRHLPDRPVSDPVGLCRVCGGPMDPVLTNPTHPTCGVSS
jgi:hypothetical protein